MFNAETLAGLVLVLVIVNLVIELALMFGLINLITKMFEHGDKLWGYATSAITIAMMSDVLIKKFLPTVGAFLGLASFLGLLIVLIFGWLRHKRYDAKKQMIILTLLFGAQLLVVIVGIAIVLSVIPAAPPTAA